MFDLDPGKMLVFGIVALAVIPPKDLPRVLRTVGKYIGQIRRMGAEFQGQLSQAMKEAELDTVRKEIEDINRSAAAHTTFAPADLMREKTPEKTAKIEPPQDKLAETPAHDAPLPIAAHEPEKSAVGPT